MRADLRRDSYWTIQKLICLANFSFMWFTVFSSVTFLFYFTILLVLMRYFPLQHILFLYYSFLYTTSNIPSPSMFLTFLLPLLFYLNFLYFIVIYFYVLHLYLIFLTFDSNAYFHQIFTKNI